MKKILGTIAVLVSLVGCQNEMLTKEEIEAKYGEIKEEKAVIIQFETNTHSIQGINHGDKYEVIWMKVK